MSRRPTAKRALRLDSLESRELLTAGGPSAEALLMLDMINQVRTNPPAAAARFTSNLDADVQATINYFNVDIQKVRNDIASATPRQPLAWNDNLAAAATWQSQDQANTGVQSHTGSDGSNSSQRVERNGYQNRTVEGENAYAYSQSVDHAMEAFLIDWGVDSLGHRNNLLQPNANDQSSYQEVGIGIANTNRPGFGPKVITQDFAARADYKPQLVGVVFNDNNHNGYINPGEGQGNAQIEATNLATGQSKSVQTWDTGGYQLPLDPGQYKLVARVGDRVFRTDYITMGTQNSLVEYNLNQPWQTESASASPVTVTPPTVSAPQLQVQMQTMAPVNTNVVTNNFSAFKAPKPKTDTWFSWSSWKSRS